MKPALLTLLLIACLCSLGACMWMGTEDREFFGKGWVNPKELDRAPAPTTPMRPVTGDAPGDVTPSAHSNGEWGTPAPF